MFRPLIGVSAAALMILGSFAFAERQRPGRPTGPPPSAPGQSVKPSFQQNQYPGFWWFQNRAGSKEYQNRIWTNSPYSPFWGNSWFPYGGYSSVWYRPYGSWNVPMSERAGFSFIFAPSYALPPISAAVPGEIAGREQGLQITEVFDYGAAKNADLRAGDIILGVGRMRTQSFEELQVALLGMEDTEIVFINGDTNKVEKMPIKVENRKIGVAVVPVVLH